MNAIKTTQKNMKCDMFVNSLENYPDWYTLTFKTLYNQFKVGVNGIDNSVEEWGYFIEALKSNKPKKLIQTNLILETDGKGNLNIYVSNDDQNVVFETSIDASVPRESLEMIYVLVKKSQLDE